MTAQVRTDTPGLARRIAQFGIEDVYVHLTYDPRLRFYIPKRWWVSERFDINVQASGSPHIELDVGRGQVTIFRPTHRIQSSSLAPFVECLEFARQVLVEANQ